MPRRPVCPLQGFSKINVAPGQTSTVAFTLSAADLQIYDVTQGWIVVGGTYNILVGSSSADIRLTGTVTVTA